MLNPMSTRHEGVVERVRTWPMGIAALAFLVVGVPDAVAQRPFPVHDPFYRSETALRTFHDGLAATGEVSYGRDVSSNIGSSTPSLGLSFRLHYMLSRRIDLNAFWDAAGTATGRTIVLSWVGVKYYWSVDSFDYAFRLAVDPASDGRVGFPQLDAAFISTKTFSPVFSSDFAVGMRRVRKGFRQFVPAEPTLTDGGPIVVAPNSASQFIDTRAMGMELHFMWSYNLIFDPAASNLFVSVMGEGGQYSLFETEFGGNSGPAVTASADDDELGETDYRGGVVWMRSGIEYNRPSYQVLPFMSVPLKQWAPENDDKSRMQLGLRLMLR